MASKRSSGQWRTRVFIGYDDKGKRLYKNFTADSKQSADLAALQWKAEHKGTRRTGMTFAQAASNFMEIRHATLSPSTRKGYTNILKNLKKICPQFCGSAVSSLDADQLQTVVNIVLKTHSPKTVRNYHAFISAVLQHAGQTTPKVGLPQKIRPEFNVPDGATLARVFEAAKGTEWEIPVLLGAIVPMRRGEICGASLSDLSDDNILHIHSAQAEDENGKIVNKPPKTVGSDRYVELPAAVADKIRQQGYICDIPITQFSKYFGRFLERNGFEHFRFHDLRHAFVSIAHAAGIPDAYIMARGGWSTNYTVNNVYRHVLDKDRKKAEGLVNGIFEGLI